MLPKFNRRRFLAVGALTATVPTFVTRTAHALAEERKSSGGRALVVIQLAGGNDGLNTLVPIGNDAYYKARPSLAIAKAKALKISDDFALHPEMGALQKLHDAGALGIVTNVGYPNPNRSHFRATEIWETSVPDKETRTGWLGRYFDAECRGVASPMLGLQLGEKPTLAFAHPGPRSVTLTNPSLFQWEKGAVTEAMARLNRVQKTENAELDFLQRTRTKRCRSRGASRMRSRTRARRPSMRPSTSLNH